MASSLLAAAAGSGRVIKIERPDGGDPSRKLYPGDTGTGGDSTIFHALNRG